MSQSTFDQNKMKRIVDWLGALAEVIAIPKDWGETAGGRNVVLRSFADFLYADFNSAVFSKESLKTLASKFDVFPRYASLKKSLDEWWTEHRPASQRAITDEAFKGWSAMDHLWLRYWNTRRTEEFGAVEIDGRRHDATNSGVVLGLIKAQSPRVYDHLIDEGFAPKPKIEDGGFSEATTRQTLDSLRDHPLRGYWLGKYRTLIGLRAPRLLPMLDAFEIEMKAA